MGVLVAVLGVLALLAAALWWWAGTEGSLDWTLRQAARWQPLTVEGVQGSLRSGLRVQRLQWEKDGLKAEVFDLRLAWQPLALLRGAVHLDSVSAQRVRIEDRRPPQPSAMPLSLALPLRATVAEAQVGQLQWVTAANSIEATGLSGNYSFDGARHQAQVDSLQWAGGGYRGQLSLGAGGAMPVEATLEGRLETAVPGSGKKLPLTFNASLAGPLADMQAKVLLQTRVFTPTVPTRASATARLTPWGAHPVPEANGDFRQLDLQALWAQAPRTSLGGQVRVQPAGTATWSVTADLHNEVPGPWDQQRLPLERLRASGEWRQGGQALVRSLDAQLGGGRVQASGQWQGNDAWTIAGQLEGVNPAAVHSRLAPLPLSGRAELAGQGQAVSFDVDLTSAGAKRKEATGVVGQLELRQALAKGRWANGLLSLPTLEVHSADAVLRAALELKPAERAGSGRATLEAPGLNARVEGRLAERSGAGTLQLTSANLAQGLAWLARVPGVPAMLGDQIAAGRGEANLAWQGGWRDPAVKGRLAAPLLQLRAAAPAAGPKAQASPNPAWVIRDAVVSVDGRLSDAAIQAGARAEFGQRRLAIELSGQGGRRSATPEVWQGQLAALHATFSDPAMSTGTWALTLRQPVDSRWASGSLDVGAGEALLAAPAGAQRERAGGDAAALVSWEPVRWRQGELRSAGRITGLPLAWLELIGGPQVSGSALSGDLVFDGQWDADLGATPRLRASLTRSRGDVSVLAEAADGTSTRVRAGVREARVSLATEGEDVTVSLRWDSERGGTAEGRLATRLARGGAAGWQWPDGAPLSGQLRAQLPRIGVWSLLAPPGWRLRGSLAADIAVSGTRAEPQLAGTLSADDLGLRSVVDGIELQGGRLRARLDGQRLLIDEFVLRGPGEGSSGGTLIAAGEGTWAAGRPQVRMTAEVNRLRASIRPDRQLTASGTLAGRHDAQGTVINGNLKVDQAHIILPDETAPKLGDDVVVRGAPGPTTRSEARASRPAGRTAAAPLTLAIDIDLGSNFRVQGQGIDVRLRGSLALSGQSLAAPRLVGSIRVTRGEYRAYGQRLDIERGIVRFTGPIDNPALDILAIRPNMVQRVGVQVTGRALAPHVRLYAEPDMPDAEKLSWLVTGRASPSGGAEAALLQQAGLALLASRSGGNKGGKGIAGALGLDELSFKREGSNGPSVTLGRRFGRNFYAAYERSLSGALGTLYIFYDLTRRVTVRAEAGERTAVDLIYTFSFD